MHIFFFCCEIFILKLNPTDGNVFRDFQLVPPSLQEQLLERATPLFVQLMLAFYLTTTPGQAALAEILDLKHEEAIHSLEQFNQLVNLIQSSHGKPASDLNPSLVA